MIGCAGSLGARRTSSLTEKVMPTPHRSRYPALVLLLTLAVGLTFAGNLTAQRQPATPVPGSARALAQADQLLSEVEAKLQSPEATTRSWRQAAYKLEASVKLRGGDAPRAIEHLNLAVALAYGGGDRTHARRLLEDIARRAQDDGDLLTSADALTRAAWIAVEQQDQHAAHRLADKALRLARSPLLSGAQRQGIQRRFAAQGTVTARASRP
jgi:hypothetical protein